MKFIVVLVLMMLCAVHTWNVHVDVNIAYGKESNTQKTIDGGLYTVWCNVTSNSTAVTLRLIPGDEDDDEATYRPEGGAKHPSPTDRARSKDIYVPEWVCDTRCLFNVTTRLEAPFFFSLVNYQEGTRPHVTGLCTIDRQDDWYDAALTAALILLGFVALAVGVLILVYVKIVKVNKKDVPPPTEISLN